MSQSNDAEAMVGLVLVAALVVLVIYSLVLAIPLGIVGFIGYYFWYRRHNSPVAKERKAREHTHALYEEAKALKRAPPDPAILIANMLLDLPPLPEGSFDPLSQCLWELFENEGYSSEGLRPPPMICNSIEGARYRDYLSQYTDRLEHAVEDTLLQQVVTLSMSNLFKKIPKSAFSSEEQDTLKFTMVLSDLFPDLGEAVRTLMSPFYADPERSFPRLLERLDGNVTNVSNKKGGRRVIPPEEYDGSDVIWAYLGGTPLALLFDMELAFFVPHKTRFEHHWIVAPPGTGKTTTLQYLLKNDLDLVAQGEASVVLMESNRDLIKAVEGLKRFGEGGDLEGKLIVIDAEDVEYPLALNVFDLGLGSAKNLSLRDREAIRNSTLSMLDYIFRALLGAELTSRQSTLFTFTIQLLLEIPNATLDTLIDLMQPKGISDYAEYLSAVDQDTRTFFDVKFESQEFIQTKSQVVDRLFAIKRIRALSRMFSAPKTKIDFYSELATSKVILINAAKSLLQEDGVEVFGRFFLAMILLAAEKRQLLPQEERLPTFVYIDECQDIIRRDEKIPIILDQARKNRVAMVLAHQRLNQMSPPVRDALFGSTGIKFASQLSDPGAMARNMNTTSDFITNQPPYTFASYIRGQTQSAISLVIPFVDLNKEERMTSQERFSVRSVMREKYARRYTEQKEEHPDEVAEARAEVLEQDHDSWG